MKPTILFRAGCLRQVLCLMLVGVTATVPSITATAQTNAAAMAVRQRLEGNSPEGPESRQAHEVPLGVQAPGAGQAPGPVDPASPEAGKIDTRYILPSAAAVVVIRPAQILSTPIAQMLPVEFVTASIGFDSVEIDEIVAFVDPGLNYGITFKFKNPIRASSIPQERRNHVQLAELAGKKYLRSVVPAMWSLYGPNNRTLVAASEPALQQLVTSADQPKSGPMMDRLRGAAAGSDVYLAIDLAKLRPLLAMAIAGITAKATPHAKQQLEILNQISAAELTLNISNPGPSSLVARCNDDAAAQELESFVQELKNAANGPQAELPGMVSPFMQAGTRYTERLKQLFPLQRDGDSFTFFRVEGQNPAQQQFVAAMVVLTGSVAGMMPEIMAAHGAASRAQRGPGALGPPGVPGAPGPPEAGQQQ